VEKEIRVYELCLELLFLYALWIGHRRTNSDENRNVNEKQKSYGIRAEVWKISASLMEGFDIVTKMFSRVKEE
jgi:hypothetical protein